MPLSTKWKKRYLCKDAHGSAIYNGEKLEIILKD